MKIKNPFFKKKNKVFLNDILKVLKIKNSKNNIQIYDIKDLSNATSKDIEVFTSSQIEKFQKIFFQRNKLLP